MDDDDLPPPPSKSSSDTTKTTVAILVALVVVLIVAGIGIATIRDTAENVKEVLSSTSTSVVAGGSGGSTTLPPANNLTPEQARIVEEMKGQVAAVRGLEWKASLPVRFLSKDQLSARVRQINADERAEQRDEFAADEAVLKLLQLIDKDVDYGKTIDSILAGGVLGYYDYKARELFVGADDLGPAVRVTLAHELAHALTDQHFDFGKRRKALVDQERTEEAFAFGALIEGDAELVATLWQERHLNERQRAEAAVGSTADTQVYARAPRYLLESLFFPYQDGLTFVRSRHRAGGFAEVDNAYRNPPTSTEHVLHPETYAAGQTWTPPALPDLAAATGCGAVDAGTLGEFDMVQLLSGEISRTDANNAALGWNGDAFRAVRCGAALGLADRWQADDAGTAGRLADALSRWARGWSGSTRSADAEGRVTGPSGSARVTRTGARVDLVLADDAATADRLARAIAG
jgi:hypothetical protein